ncbi:MAG TPA: hypothetical protein VNE39_02095 [Planctomycetota bacterium]|nr:hypothetical protein [Planctomycetota bacterium]
MRTVVAGLLCLAGALWAGEAADLDALKKQAQDLREKERALRTKIEEIRAKITAAPDVAKLRDAEAAADKAYDAARKGDAAYAAALKAHADAHADYLKAVQDKVAANAEAKAILADIAGMADRAADCAFQEALARLELDHTASPINVQLDKDPELAQLRAAFYQAADKDAREKARKAYEDARKAKKDAMPEAKRIAERIEAARKGRADLRTAEAEAQKKLSALRRTVEASDDADLKAARDKVAAAAKAVQEAMSSDAIKAARKPRDDAREALMSKVAELLGADKDAAALAKEREALRTQMAELDKQIREATKK